MSRKIVLIIMNGRFFVMSSVMAETMLGRMEGGGGRERPPTGHTGESMKALEEMN